MTKSFKNASSLNPLNTANTIMYMYMYRSTPNVTDHFQLHFQQGKMYMCTCMYMYMYVHVHLQNRAKESYTRHVRSNIEFNVYDVR